MARIICDVYKKEDKAIWGDDRNDEFNRKILAVNDMYGWLYARGILKESSFVCKDYDDTVYFALDANDLAPYRREMEQSGVENAALAVRHIFDEDYTPCHYSGAIELGWTMFSYRDVDGCVGKSWECSLIKGLDTKTIYDVDKVKETRGVKEAVKTAFEAYEWEPTLDELRSSVKAQDDPESYRTSDSPQSPSGAETPPLSEGSLPPGINPVESKGQRAWQSYVDIDDGTEHGKTLDLGTYYSVDSAISAREEFFEKASSMDRNTPDYPAGFIQLAQDIRERAEQNYLVETLISAMAEYGLGNNWSDSEVIDALVDVGITREDFQNAGYGNFVKDYFEDGREDDTSFEKLKSELFLAGNDAIQDFLGYEVDPYEDKDVTERRLDMAYEQMPDDVISQYYSKYNIGAAEHQPAASMKATNIEWDVDCPEDMENLPTEIEIPVGMDENDISDYLSDVTGFCHQGYVLEKCEESVLAEQIPPCRFNLGDKVKIPYISDCNPHNHEVGEVAWIHPYKSYPTDDINNPVWKHQMAIIYPDGQSILVDPVRNSSGVVSEVVLVEAKSPRPSLDSVIHSASSRATETQSASPAKTKEPEHEL